MISSSITVDKAKDRYYEGMRLLKGSDFHGAVACFNRAIFLDDECAEYYVGRSLAHLQLGDFQSAIINMKRALIDDPENSELSQRVAGLLDARGTMLLDLGDPESAASAFSEAVSLYSLDVKFYVHRASAYIAMDSLGDALKDVDHAVFIDPRNAELYILRARLYWSMGLKSQGVQNMEMAMALDPEHVEVRAYEEERWAGANAAYQSAAGQMLAGNPDAAAVDLTRALALAPRDVKALVLRAAARREQGRYKESLDDIEEAARSFRGEPSAHDESKRGRQDKPKPSVLDEDAPREHPEITRQRNLTLNSIGLAQYKEGNFKKAVVTFSQVIQSETEMMEASNPGSRVDRRFFINRGDSYRELGRLQQALSDYHVAYDASPEDPGVRLRLSGVHDAFGVSLFNQGECAQAEIEFSTAIGYHPHVADYFVHRANAAFYQQRIELAFKDFSIALRLNPGHEEAQRKMQLFKGSDTDIGAASRTDARSALTPAGGMTASMSSTKASPAVARGLMGFGIGITTADQTRPRGGGSVMRLPPGPAAGKMSAVPPHETRSASLVPPKSPVRTVRVGHKNTAVGLQSKKLVSTRKSTHRAVLEPLAHDERPHYTGMKSKARTVARSRARDLDIASLRTNPILRFPKQGKTDKGSNLTRSLVPGYLFADPSAMFAPAHGRPGGDSLPPLR